MAAARPVSAVVSVQTGRPRPVPRPVPLRWLHLIGSDRKKSSTDTSCAMVPVPALRTFAASAGRRRLLSPSPSGRESWNGHDDAPHRQRPATHRPHPHQPTPLPSRARPFARAHAPSLNLVLGAVALLLQQVPLAFGRHGHHLLALGRGQAELVLRWERKTEPRHRTRQACMQTTKAS